jgi:hypothetical protein
MDAVLGDCARTGIVIHVSSTISNSPQREEIFMVTIDTFLFEWDNDWNEARGMSFGRRLKIGFRKRKLYGRGEIYYQDS